MARALRPVVERLETRQLMFGDGVTTQTVPFALDYSTPATGAVLDKDGEATGFTYVYANKNNNEYQAAKLDVDQVAGTLAITTTGDANAGSAQNGDNALTSAPAIQFNGKGATGFSIVSRIVNPGSNLTNLAGPYRQQGIIFGPNLDNYVKLVIGTPTSSSHAIQMLDETTTDGTTFTHTLSGATSEVTLASILGAGKTLADVTVAELKLSAVYSTGVVSGYYRLNDGQWRAMPATVTLTGAKKEEFFSLADGAGGTINASRAGLMAMHKNNSGAIVARFDNFNVIDGTPDTNRPKITTIRPAAGSTNVFRDVFIGTDLSLPNGAGVDKATLLNNNVSLVRTSDNALVDGVANTSGGGDVIVFTPDGPLAANTQYTFRVTASVKDTAGFAFEPFNSSFTTGTTFENPTNSSIAFNQITQATAQGQDYSAVTFGPDGKLYAATLDGLIQRFSVDPTTGNLGPAENISTVTANNGNVTRMVIGLTFDPTSTASDLKLWVTHSVDVLEGGPDWSSKLSLLTGAGLQTYKDYLIGLPRSYRDHLSNQISFKPGDNDTLYFSQGSMSSTGRKDSTWGNREEHMLSAAILSVDLAQLRPLVANTGLPLDVQTESGGTYNPFAANAIVKIFASGVRNAYDLLWHSNGQMYSVTNGSGGGGNTPGSYPNAFTPGIQRLDGTQYSGPTVSPLTNLTVQPDLFFKVQAGGYYGHPNPWRQEYVLQGGNPTTGVDPFEVPQYAVGTLPDSNWRGDSPDNAIYNIGYNYSANGMTEYKGAAFGGVLDGAVLMTRYSGGDDIIVLKLDASGNVTQKLGNIAGFTGFSDPLDLVQHPTSGFLYVVENGGKKITLLTPATPGANVEVDKTKLLYNDVRTDSNASRTQAVTIKNTGSSDLTIASIVLSGANASLFIVSGQPANGTLLSPGASATVNVAFRAASGSPTTPQVATLTINTNDPDSPSIAVALRGLPTTGTGGGNEPSLQRVLDLLQIPINVGDTNPADTYLVPPTLTGANPRGLVGEEAYVQNLVKADANAPVTIETLAMFGNSTNPVMRFGYQSANNPRSTKNQLFTVPTADAQWVAPTVNGITSFDPGADPFGLYSTWPGFDNINGYGIRDAWSADQLNDWQTADTNTSAKRKFRFFPLKDANGVVVPNAYLVGVDEFNNRTLADYNDIIFVVRNVAPSAVASMVVDNTDNTILPDVLTFNRINNPVVANATHERSVVRIRNTGNANLQITGVSISTTNQGANNSPSYVLENAPAFPQTIAAGAFLDVTVRFVATSGSQIAGTLTVTGNDPTAPTKTIKLNGWRQTDPEGNFEPGLQVIPSLFGFTTVTTNANGSPNTNNGQYLAIGEEILSDYWVKADGTDSVYARALVGMRNNTSGDNGGSAISYRIKNGANANFTPALAYDGDDYQSLYPRKNNALASQAAGYFRPGNNIFTMRIVTSYGAHLLNPQRVAGSTIYGHEIRVYPIKDADGQYVPNTYLMAQNFGGSNASNFDYQDDVWIVSNIRPETGIAAPVGLGYAATNTLGVSLNWESSIASNLAGYNVYRSTLPTSGFTKLTPALLTQPKFVDTTGTPGTTYYYRVTSMTTGAAPKESYPTSIKATRPINNTPPPLAPQNLVATATSGTEIGLTWSDVDNENGYTVERSLNGVDGWVSAGTTGANQPAFSDSNLSPVTQYFYRVRGTNGAVQGADSAVASATTLAVPAQVTGFTATANGSNAIDLAWTDLIDETGFQVERSADGLNGWSLIASPLQDVVAYSDTTVQFGQTWFYRVRGINANGNGAFSAVQSATTPVVPAAAPASLTATAAGSDKVDLSWTDVYGETGFRIERSPDGVDGWTLLSNVPASNGVNPVTFQDTLLTASTTYYYRVFATNSAGDSATASPVASATTGIAAPGAVQNLVASPAGPGNISLAWTDLPAATSFEVERSPDGITGWSQVATPVAGSTGYLDTGRTAGVTYFYQVRGVNAGGPGAFSAVAQATVSAAAVPGTPDALTAVASTVFSGQITLDWSNVTAETSFLIERSLNGANGWSIVGSVGADVTTFTNGGLAPATQYFFRVRGANAVGEGSYSPTANATTLASGPSSLSATGVAGAVNLSWAAVTGADSYKVERSLNGTTFTEVAAPAGTGTTYADSAVTGGVTYHYRVRAVIGATDTAYSPVASTVPANGSLSTVRIDSGNTTAAYTDPSGNVWAVDGFVTGGTASATSYAVGNTTADPLYYTRRFGAMQYAIPVANGSYSLNLHVAENIKTGAGQRKFDVFAEGVQILDEYDIFAEFGYRNAGVKTFAVSVTDGLLNVELALGGIENPLISGIEVLPPATVTAPAAPTGLLATPAGATQVNLSWTDAATEAGYKVERSTNGTDFVQIATTAANVVAYSDSMAKPNTQYSYRVRSANAGGDSADYSNVAIATTANAAPASPSVVSAVGISTTEVSIGWAGVENVTSYLVERSLDGTGGWTSAGTTLPGVTTLTDSGLTGDTTYYYRVTAVNGVGNSLPSPVDAGTTSPNVAPAAPTDLVATTASASAINLTWTDVATIESGYEVDYSTSPTFANGVTTVPLAANAASYPVTGLTASTTYYFRVRAVNGNGQSVYSGTATATTSAPVVGKLTGTIIGTTGSNAGSGNTRDKAFDGSLTTFFDAAGANGSWVGLDLGTATAITSVKYAPRPSFAGRMVNGKFQGSTTITFAAGTVTDLYTIPSAPVYGALTTVAISNTTAFQYVRYLAPNGGYGNVAEVEFYGATTPPPAAPAAPTNLVATTASTSAINLTWTDVATDETGYEVDRSTSPTFASGVTTVTLGANSASYPATGLTASTTYYFRVRAVNGAVQSAYGNTASATTNAAPVPTAPTNLAATPASATAIDLTWTDAATDETGYEVDRSTSSTFASGVTTVSLAANSTGYPATGLAPSTTYYFRVRAINGAGPSADSNTATTTTPSAPVPAAPTNLVATTASASAINLAWTDVATDETGYEVDRSTSPTFASGVTTVTLAANSASYPATGLTASTTYYFRVRAINGTLQSAYGNTATATTNAAPAGVKLTGTLIGTTGSNGVSGNTIAKAVDGDLATYFDAAGSNGAWVGLDLGTATVITSVKYAPRANLPARMVGGKFQGSTTANFAVGTNTDLFTISSAPTAGVLTTATIVNTTAFRYVRYLSPNGSYGNVAEVEFYG